MSTNTQSSPTLNNNKSVVESLYKALAKGDPEAAVRLLATDLEWWFHGPPHCQHMMRVLTGESDPQAVFPFKPKTVTAIEGTQWVVAEGWKGAHSYWVHVWTVKDGVITQFREYFNTLVTVRDLRRNNKKIGSCDGEDNEFDDEKRSGSRGSSGGGVGGGYVTLWQSQLPWRYSVGNPNSMPGLVLAV